MSSGTLFPSVPSLDWQCTFVQATNELDSQLAGVKQTNASLRAELDGKKAECNEALLRLSALQKQDEGLQSKLLKQSQESTRLAQLLKEDVANKDKALQVSMTLHVPAFFLM